MGNHRTIKADCPLYKGILDTVNSQVLAIRCENLSDNLGFDAEALIRMKNWAELKDYAEIFCSDRWDGCPYFKAWKRDH